MKASRLFGCQAAQTPKIETRFFSCVLPTETKRGNPTTYDTMIMSVQPYYVHTSLGTYYHIVM